MPLLAETLPQCLDVRPTPLDEPRVEQREVLPKLVLGEGEEVVDVPPSACGLAAGAVPFISSVGVDQVVVCHFMARFHPAVCDHPTIAVDREDVGARLTGVVDVRSGSRISTWRSPSQSQ
jgi:hypothetical protein